MKPATVVILGIWLAVVILTATTHEFWRDEVRPLSLARAANSPLDLYGLTKYDGHPVLWYLLLYIGKFIADTPLILPIISIVIAFGAVTVFMFCAPFQLWIRCLFIFGALPVYEYSVMARNYGISMLLLFVGAVLYRNRAKYPLLLAFVLALLANSNVYSAILTCLIAGLWAWDAVFEQTAGPIVRRSSLYLAFVIIFAGVLVSAAWTIPRKGTILTSARHSVTVGSLGHALLSSTLEPERTFSTLAAVKMLPRSLYPLAGLLLYLAVFGLLHRPNLFLAALGGQMAFGVIFRLVYGGSYQHQGLFLIFLLFLYWVFIESADKRLLRGKKGLLFNAGLYIAMLILLVGSFAMTKYTVFNDIVMEMSSSKAFGKFLNTSAIYHNAIIIPEPDYLIESLPYYAGNMIYLPREHRFGTTVSWTTKAKASLSLADLLFAARDLKAVHGKPVLIVLGHWDINGCSPSQKKHYSYNKVFSWDRDELLNFNQSTVLVTEFKSALGDENYRVFTLR